MNVPKQSVNIITSSMIILIDIVVYVQLNLLNGKWQNLSTDYFFVYLLLSTGSLWLYHTLFLSFDRQNYRSRLPYINAHTHFRKSFEFTAAIIIIRLNSTAVLNFQLIQAGLSYKHLLLIPNVVVVVVIAIAVVGIALRCNA